MTESNPEKEEEKKKDQETEAALNTSPDKAPDMPLGKPPDVSPDISPDIAVEPNKRLVEAEPEELVQALRQVFTGKDERPETKSASLASLASSASSGSKNSAVAGQSERDQNQPSYAPNQARNAREPEAKSGYTNPFALFADVFYGVLMAPSQTFAILSNCSKFPPTLANLFLTFVLVFVSLALPAAIKVGAAGGSTEGILKASAFILANLADWAMLSFILYYLSIWLRGNRLTLGNAFIATGWAYLPFAFFAPVACFKGALGNGFTVFACGPALWFIVLQWLAFQTSLRTTTIKLALIALVVPPVFCLVYLFWIGLAVFSLLAQLLSHLT